MKLSSQILFIALSGLIVLSGFTKLNFEKFEDKWNGTVSFIQSVTGPDIIISEWKMEGSFNNGVGTVTHSAKYQYKDGVGEIKRDCSNTSDSKVEITVDESGKTYTVMVLGVLDCTGTAIEYGEKKNFRMPGGDTAIWISDQPLGQNRNALSGTLTFKNGPAGRGNIQTLIYKWSLVKAP